MNLKATVSGSFKFLADIQRKVVELRKHGVIVLSPTIGRQKRVERGFVFLEHDKGTPKSVELQHLNAITKSDFLYVVNPDGYVGPSTSLEIGYAISQGVPVFSTSTPSDPVFALLVDHRNRVSQVVKLIRQGLPIYTKPVTLGRLQAYVSHMTRVKKFDSETLEEKLLLFTEEVGELARAARVVTGLKTSPRIAFQKDTLSAELSDLIIYIADIANSTSTDLESAVLKKVKSDFRRTWRKRQ